MWDEQMPEAGKKGKGKGKGWKGKGKGKPKDPFFDVPDLFKQKTVQQVARVTAHKDIVNAVIRVDADKVYTGGKDGVLRTWTAVAKDNGAVELQADLNVDIGVEVCSLLYEPSSQWLFCGLGDGRIRGYHKPTVGEQDLKGHASNVWCMLIHQSCLISGSWDSTVRVWQPDANQQFKCVHTLSTTGGIKHMHILGNNLWTGGAKGLMVFDLTSMERVHQKTDKEVGAVMSLLEFQGHIVVSSLWGSCKVFTAAGEKTHEEKLESGKGARSIGITSMVGVVHPVSNEAMLVWGLQGGSCAVYILPDFKLKGRWEASRFGDVRALCDAGNGMLLSAGSDGTVVLWKWAQFA